MMGLLNSKQERLFIRELNYHAYVVNLMDLKEYPQLIMYFGLAWTFVEFGTGFLGIDAQSWLEIGKLKEENEEKVVDILKGAVLVFIPQNVAQVIKTISE